MINATYTAITVQQHTPAIVGLCASSSFVAYGVRSLMQHKNFCPVAIAVVLDQRLLSLSRLKSVRTSLLERVSVVCDGFARFIVELDTTSQYELFYVER